MTEPENAIATDCVNNIGGGCSYNSICEETSKRITSLRFLLAVFVILIHNNFIIQGVFKTGSKILFCPSDSALWIHNFVVSFARCSVSIFFMFSSYLQFRKNDKYTILVKKRVRSLVVPYILWFLILVVFRVPLVRLFNHIVHSTPIGNPSKLFLYQGKRAWFRALVGNYTHWKTNDVCGPSLVHFWYVRDLFMLVLVSPLLKKVVKFFPIETILFTAWFFIAGKRPFFVQSEALFFYTLGLYWAEDKIDFFALADKCHWIVLVPIVFLFFKLQGAGFVIKFLDILIMFKLSALICKNEKVFAVSKYLAGYSFFLFAVHLTPLMGYLRVNWLRHFPMKNSFFCLAEYFGVCALVVIIGTGIGILLKKICPKLFALLTGGRIV